MTPDDRSGGILGRITAPPEESSVPSSSVDVLLVVAEVEVRRQVAGLLRRAAHTVVEAESAASAAEAVRLGCAPRMLLLDLEGTSPSERTALSGLARDPARGGAPVAVLSRDGNEELPGLRPAGRVLKPVEASELVEMVRRLCGTLEG